MFIFGYYNISMLWDKSVFSRFLFAKNNMIIVDIKITICDWNFYEKRSQKGI